MGSTEAISGAAGIKGLGNTGEMNLSTQLAMLQLEMAMVKKTQAEDLIKEIKAENATIREARQFLQDARAKEAAGKAAPDTAEMRAFCSKNNITPPKATLGIVKKAEWTMFVKNLETFVEGRGTDTATKMVQLEDLMGKYHAWEQGSSKSLSDGNQTLSSIMSR